MIDQQQFRDLMASVCSPVAVVTTMLNGTAYGATVSSLAALSLDPPLVSVAFARDSRLLGHLLAAGRFAVSILGHDQDDLAIRFARPGADRFAGVHWFAEDGLPRLAGAPGWMVCDLQQTVAGGDHRLLFGQVRLAGLAPGRPPLVYAHRTFGTHSRFAERPRPAIADQIAACAS